MLRPSLLAASIAGVYFVIAVKPVGAAAGNLDKPGIAVPSQGGNRDATAAAMNAILAAHEKQFAGGHFINAHTILTFAGGTKTINSLLAELAKVEGAALYVRFSNGKEFGDALPEFSNEPPKPYDCVIEHSAWADPHSLHITICLTGNVAIQELSIPAIRGHAIAPKD